MVSNAPSAARTMWSGNRKRVSGSVPLVKRGSMSLSRNQRLGIVKIQTKRLKRKLGKKTLMPRISWG